MLFNITENHLKNGHFVRYVDADVYIILPTFAEFSILMEISEYLCKNLLCANLPFVAMQIQLVKLGTVYLCKLYNWVRTHYEW